MMRARVALVLTVVAKVVVVMAQPERQDEWLPVSQLPLTEQMPAAPLLVGAYVVVLVGLFAYVLSLARRIGTIQREIERLDSDLKRRARV
jgi:CcmD family protein